jgi:exodeoxyribonuclease VII large subunit
MPDVFPFDIEPGEIAESMRPNVAEFTVSEISFALKRTLEDTFGHVRVRGEISGFRGAHASGHCYFSLKDKTARIDAVIWRATFMRLKSKLQEGLEVIATGRITAYPSKSSYQIVVDAIEPAGAGALMALLDERRRKLAAEGLFDEARKRPIPYLPRVIGIVTSPTGAVIRDILHRLAERFPRRVIVWPVRVQGESSAAEVAAAIRGFNAITPGGSLPRPDVLIIARGGGSLEDLWSFNEEVVVRAAAKSAIPLISAVGHETDWTLIDHAADKRCPTPTAAAECAVPVRSEVTAALASLAARLDRANRRMMSERRTRVRAAARALPRPDDMLALARQRYDGASGRMAQALRANTRLHRAAYERCASRLSLKPALQQIARQREALQRLSRHSERGVRRILDQRRRAVLGHTKLLASLSYRSVLQRGFALVRGAAGTPLRTAADVAPGQALGIEFRDGTVNAHADGGTRPSAKPTRPPRPDQGSLF